MIGWVVGVALAVAQTPSGCQDSLMAGARRVPQTVYISVRPARPHTKLPRPLADSLLERIAGMITLPDTAKPVLLSGPVAPPKDPNGKKTWMIGDITQLARLGFDATGQLVAKPFVEGAREPRLDVRFATAVLEAVRDPLPRPPKNRLRNDVVAFDIGLYTSDTVTEKERRDNASKVKKDELLERTIGTLDLPYLPGGRAPKPLGRQEPPQYPEAVRERNLSGDVTARFVISEYGRIAPNSLWIMEATYEELLETVWDAMRTYTYAPAYVGSCPFPIKVGQPFRFRITRY
jgi:hypothetical protein